MKYFMIFIVLIGFIGSKAQNNPLKISLTTEEGSPIEIYESSHGAESLYLSYEHNFEESKRFEISATGEFYGSATRKIEIHPGFFAAEGATYELNIEEDNYCQSNDEETSDFISDYEPERDASGDFTEPDEKGRNFEIVSDKVNEYVKVWKNENNELKMQYENCVSSGDILVSNSAYSISDIANFLDSRILNLKDFYIEFERSFSVSMNKNGFLTIGYFELNQVTNPDGSTGDAFIYCVSTYLEGELLVKHKIKEFDNNHLETHLETFAVHVMNDGNIKIGRISDKLSFGVSQPREIKLITYELGITSNKLDILEKQVPFDQHCMAEIGLASNTYTSIRSISMNEKNDMFVHYAANTISQGLKSSQERPHFAILNLEALTLFILDYDIDIEGDDIEGKGWDIHTAGGENLTYDLPISLKIGHIPNSENFYISYSKSESKGYWVNIGTKKLPIYEWIVGAWQQNVMLEVNEQLDLIYEHDLTIPGASNYIEFDDKVTFNFLPFASVDLSYDGRFMHVLSPLFPFYNSENNTEVNGVVTAVYDLKNKEFVQEKQHLFPEELDVEVTRRFPIACLKNCQVVFGGYEIDSENTFSSKIVNTDLCNIGINDILENYPPSEGGDCGGIPCRLRADLDEELFEENEYGVNIYPNPSTGQFTLDLPYEGSVQIMDMIGRKVYENNLAEGSHSIDISDYNSGIYMVRVQHGTEISTLKMIKE